MATSAARSGVDGRDRAARIACGAAGLALVALFALGPPGSVTGILAVALAVLAAGLAVPARARIVLLPLLAVSVLTGQFARGFNVFDILALLLGTFALASTFAATDRAAWEIHRPGALAIAYLVAPLLAVPFTVVSLESFFGQYKSYLLWVLVFLSLRRVTPRDRAHVLLWAFPLVGTIGVMQLFLKTAGLGALLFARLGFRNFYTRLAWGQSDYISAVLETCICGTILLIVLERRPWVRVALALAVCAMAEGVLMLFSRAGVVSLGVFGLIVAIGAGGARSLVAGAGVIAVGLVGLASPGGQVILTRFTDPAEYTSWFYRLILWQSAWNRFLAHPWTGLGLNQGRFQHDLQHDESASNLFLEALSEQGIPGFIVLVVVLVALVRMMLRLRPAGREDSTRLVRVVALGLLAQVVVHASGEPILHGIPLSVLLVYFFAWITLQDPGPTRAPAPVAP